jgi:hypothetical protein
LGRGNGRGRSKERGDERHRAKSAHKHGTSPSGGPIRYQITNASPGSLPMAVRTPACPR